MAFTSKKGSKGIGMLKVNFKTSLESWVKYHVVPGEPTEVGACDHSATTLMPRKGSKESRMPEANL